MPGPVAKLMKAGAVIIDLVKESRLRRNLNEIPGRNIVGAVAANPEIRARRCNQRFGAGDNLALRQVGRVGGQVFGQAVALVCIEHGIAFEKRHRARRLARLAHTFPFGFRGEAVGINNRRAALAFANTPAK